jgi:hypothetical protein
VGEATRGAQPPVSPLLFPCPQPQAGRPRFVPVSPVGTWVGFLGVTDCSRSRVLGRMCVRVGESVSAHARHGPSSI